MKNIKNDRGTTLIEVLVSLILIAITALGGIALCFHATEMQAIVLHKKMAIELANNQMEKCRRSGCVAGLSDVTISGLNITNGMTITSPASPTWAGYDDKIVNIGWNEAGPSSMNFNVRFTTLVKQ